MRAEQLRTIAELEADAKIMNALIAIAKDYDRMAENMEAIDRANKNSG
jgi:thiazole synthase ThiGH ThiG subunit